MKAEEWTYTKLESLKRGYLVKNEKASFKGLSELHKIKQDEFG